MDYLINIISGKSLIYGYKDMRFHLKLQDIEGIMII